MDQELRAYLEEMEARIGARMGEQFSQMEARIGERVQTESRQTRVLLEGMNDNIRLLAEGVIGVTERLEAHQAETARNLQDVKEMLSPYYRDLDGRAQRLESDVQLLDRRVGLLESKSERKSEDPLETIRKKFGKLQA